MLLQRLPRVPLLLLMIIMLRLSLSAQVIDIFTNYPNTREAMEEYTRILQQRQARRWNLHDYFEKIGHRDLLHSLEDHQELESEHGVFQEPAQPLQPLQQVHYGQDKLDINNLDLVFDSGYITTAKPPKSGWNSKEDNRREMVTEFLRRYLVQMHRRQSERQERTLITTNWIYDAAAEGTTEASEGTGTRLLSTLKRKTKKLANKFLSIFTVIRFDNFECTAESSSGVQYDGTCYLASQCESLGGEAMGECAQGHGVCCVFRSSCGDSASQNCTYFESPGYPNYYPIDGGTMPPTLAPTTTTTRNPLTPDPRLRRLGLAGFAGLSRHAEHAVHANSSEIEEARQESGDGDDQADALACLLEIERVNDDVQRMRIEFLDLELRSPNSNGNCVDERLVIAGLGLRMTVPVICGYNTGQHIWVDVSALSGPLQIQVLANRVERKRFRLRICQFTDGCAGLNCLQYFEGITGFITTFNYDQAATFSRSTPGYLNNLNYAVCIQREPGYCSITYSTTGPQGVNYPFQLRNYEGSMLTVPEGQAGAGVINCPDDYIVVNGIRLCGDRLNDGSVNANFSQNAPVTDLSGGPIVLPVRTNGARNGRGFRLYYMQNPCTSNVPIPRI